MGYNLLINGVLVYWGYNPLTNHLLTSWDIQVLVTCKDVFVFVHVKTSFRQLNISEAFQGSSRYFSESGLVDKASYYDNVLVSLVKKDNERQHKQVSFIKPSISPHKYV